MKCPLPVQHPRAVMPMPCGTELIRGGEGPDAVLWCPTCRKTVFTLDGKESLNG